MLLKIVLYLGKSGKICNSLKQVVTKVLYKENVRIYDYTYKMRLQCFKK
jgi:hypothetical protein